MKSFIQDLKDSNNLSYKYFEKIRKDIKSGKIESKQYLKSCGAITQYADFSNKLESKLSEIILLLDDIIT